VYATASGLPRKRVAEVLEMVGLAEFADRRVGGYSLGMRQRLSLAYTMLGDPGVFVLDEPINGLDPEGIRWIRGFLQSLAQEGRTVLVSSHLLSEVQQSVDEVVIISKGRLVKSGTLASLELDTEASTIIDSPDRAALGAALAAAGLQYTEGRNGLIVAESDPGLVGHAAFVGGVEVSALHRLKSGLEESFLALVNGEAE
jgi:ABC-2 type transport system ATP-binding protein